MKKTLCLLVLLIFLACSTEKKVEEISKKFPLIKLKLSKKGLERKGLWRQNLCISDIDADGNLDIVAPPPRGEDRPVIFLGDGKGNWREWKEVEFPALPFGYGGVDVADLDKNGLPDLAIACHSGRIYVLLQKEKGKFENFSDGFPSPEKFSSRVVKFVDFDGDGVEEILTLSEGMTKEEKQLYRKQNQRVFKLIENKWEEIPVIFDKYPSECYGDYVFAADFNLDGKIDFATACNFIGSKAIIFKNNGKNFSFENLSEIPDRSFTFNIRGADFNKDGREDLLLHTYTMERTEETEEKPETAVVSRVSVFFNLKDGWEMKEIFRHNSGKDNLHFRAIAAGDLNNDGLPDVAAILDDGNIYVSINKDGRNFELAKVEGFVVKGRSYWMDIKDINKDGLNDLIVAYGSEKSGGDIDVYINETLGNSAR